MRNALNEKFNPKQNAISHLSKALGHPARIAILEYLMHHKACNVRELVIKLPLSQATVSQHLSELKKADLIVGTCKGTSTVYCINSAVFLQAKKMTGDFFNSFGE